MRITTIPYFLTVLFVVCMATAIQAVESTADSSDVKDGIKERLYSPFIGNNYPRTVYFGDTHFHTELSFDAGLIGTSLDVHDGFRMARGEKVISNTSQSVQLIRPLDFLVITDHTEMIDKGEIGLVGAIYDVSSGKVIFYE